jgi:hypothetical protein
MILEYQRKWSLAFYSILCTFVLWDQGKLCNQDYNQGPEGVNHYEYEIVGITSSCPEWLWC